MVDDVQEDTCPLVQVPTRTREKGVWRVRDYRKGMEGPEVEGGVGVKEEVLEVVDPEVPHIGPKRRDVEAEVADEGHPPSLSSTPSLGHPDQHSRTPTCSYRCRGRSHFPSTNTPKGRSYGLIGGRGGNRPVPGRPLGG